METKLPEGMGFLSPEVIPDEFHIITSPDGKNVLGFWHDQMADPLGGVYLFTSEEAARTHLENRGIMGLAKKISKDEFLQKFGHRFDFFFLDQPGSK